MLAMANLMDQTASSLGIGGQCLEYFHLHIGVGQGDPRSAYFFLLINDVLERLATQTLDNKIPYVCLVLCHAL
jgi:hypothetical protein